MEKEETRLTWKRLLIPFLFGLLIFISGTLWHWLGSKRSDPQVYSFFIALLGAVLTIYAGFKLYKRYLKEKK